MFQLISALIFIFFVIFAVGLERKNDAGNSIINYNDNWTVLVNGQEKHYAQLPKEIKTNGSRTILLTKHLPDKIEEHGTICFFSNKMSVRTFAEEELIYSLSVDEGSYSKQPGSAWNFIELREDYAGKNLSIELTPAYSQEKVRIPAIEYSSFYNLLSSRFIQGIIPFCLSVVMLIFGILMLYVWLFYRHKLHLYSGVMWLGIFSIFISVWSVLETQILPIFLGHNLIFTNLSFICLKLLFIPIVMFVSYTFDLRDNKTLKFFCYVSIVDFYVTVLLQVLGIADFAQTIFVAHILFGSAAIWMIYLSGKVLWSKRFEKKQKKRAVITHAVCMSLVCFATGADMYQYYFANYSDSGYFCRIALFIYILFIGNLILDDTVRLIRKGEEVETIREDAVIDGLTKMKNRNAFLREIAMMKPEQFEKVGVVMFDLNNLKFFNDYYGHNMGDYYIIICSEVVIDIFGSYGDVYRIGGDEFCAVVYDVTDAKFSSLQELMGVRINALNGQYLQKKMSIASGYAIFDKNLDLNLNDTLQRADKYMYDKKSSMKDKKTEGSETEQNGLSHTQF